MVLRTCAVEGCGSIAKSRGWCNKHYQRWKKHGDPHAGGRDRAAHGEPGAFFEEAVTLETDECVIWPYGLVDGYGVLTVNGKSGRVSRLALERRVGPAPVDKPLACHGPCHTRACFNYRHLSWGSHKENATDRHRDASQPRGEAHYRFNVLPPQRAEIIKRYQAGGVTQTQLATEYGCTQPHISRILRG